mmetsp:Transcript_28441/g.32522  ORF Transcript_28441/g.32522 Transcript_28441/m.32522 type:complete len:216 (-) Transcript_28441:158-805(-)|eukprot:CAMPEP_0194145310 /NCGR_PEP_ID=MMETSP0152-20130528/16527_1 /TAXON_ID=1049557 /ORGANISM="Thalassiothrix antarctica, Strain L6-D1" /LENGTH=215 /DNA_ID=CAMNT_0038845475 /DNA_START=50 /DNA_END=697 /DNA_ORIENTATION=-
MKTFIIASLIVTAAAFAPANTDKSSTSLMAKPKKGAKGKGKAAPVATLTFESELGAQPPLGFFDPLGLVADGDQAKFDRLRFVELKHGRISMLAVVGYLVQEAGIRLPGNIDYAGTSFSSIRNGFAAFKDMPSGGIAQLVLFVGFLELAVMKDITGGKFIGDFRNDSFDLGWDTFDAETQMQKRGIELNQGRAAMMGILALMVHEQLGVSLIPHL